MKRILCLLFALAFGARAALTQTTITPVSGTDFGTTINAAFSTYAGTIRIPAGSYSYSVTIAHPGGGHRLVCDAGTTLTYTGSGDAITLANGNIAPDQNAGIDGGGGCTLQGSGTGSTQNGIHIYPSNHTFVRNMRITGFNNGIYNTGANSVEINNDSIFSNATGIYLTQGSEFGNGYAPNAVHVEDCEISGNTNWGLMSIGTSALGNVISNNVFEGNGSGNPLTSPIDTSGTLTGDIRLDGDYGTSVTGNYFESNGPGVLLGDVANDWGISVVHNYFTAPYSASNAGTSAILIGYGLNFNIEENLELTGHACFIDIITGPDGGSGNMRGEGTNRYASTSEWCNHGTGTTTP